MTDHERVSDVLLSRFMTEQREHNRLSNMRQASIEDIVIGPVIRGSAGAVIYNGDGLPMRDDRKGLARRRNWRQLAVGISVQMLGLATAVIILIAALH